MDFPTESRSSEDLGVSPHHVRESCDISSPRSCGTASRQQLPKVGVDVDSTHNTERLVAPKTRLENPVVGENTVAHLSCWLLHCWETSDSLLSQLIGYYFTFYGRIVALHSCSTSVFNQRGFTRGVTAESFPDVLIGVERVCYLLGPI